MKKLLAVFLALMMVLSVSLMACKKDDNVNDDAEVEDDDEFIVNKNKKDTDTAKADDSENEGADTSNGGVSTAWVTSSGTIFLRADNVAIRRATTSNQEDIIATKNMGESFTYEAYNNSWYKITYGEQTAYVAKALATINQSDVTFVAHATIAEGTKLHLTGDMYLRTAPAVSEQTSVGVITPAIAEAGSLTLISVNGTNSWVKVHFTGKIGTKDYTDATTVYYINTQYIQEFAGSSSSGGSVLG